MKLLITAFFLLSTFCLQAQILKKIIDRTKQKTEDKISEKISDKVSDAASKPVDDATSKRHRNADTESSDASESHGSTKSPAKSLGEKKRLATYSKFDFVPGDKILVYEDFSQDAIGDFPDKWNTNGSGELVRIDGEQGKWLKINKKGAFIPEFINNLPENFTLEFDLICNENFSFSSSPFSLMLLSGGPDKALEYDPIRYGSRSGVVLKLHPQNSVEYGGTARILTYNKGESGIDNELKTTQFNSEKGNTRIRVSVWRQSSV